MHWIRLSMRKIHRHHIDMFYVLKCISKFDYTAETEIKCFACSCSVDMCGSPGIIPILLTYSFIKIFKHLRISDAKTGCQHADN